MTFQSRVALHLVLRNRPQEHILGECTNLNIVNRLVLNLCTCQRSPLQNVLLLNRASHDSLGVETCTTDIVPDFELYGELVQTLCEDSLYGRHLRLRYS